MDYLKENLALHKEWLLDNSKGIRLDLSNTTLDMQTLVIQPLDMQTLVMQTLDMQTLVMQTLDIV